MRTIRKNSKEFRHVTENQSGAQYFNAYNELHARTRDDVAYVLANIGARGYKLAHNGTGYVVVHFELPGTYVLDCEGYR